MKSRNLALVAAVSAVIALCASACSPKPAPAPAPSQPTYVAPSK